MASTTRAYIKSKLEQAIKHTEAVIECMAAIMAVAADQSEQIRNQIPPLAVLADNLLDFIREADKFI